MLHLLSPTRQYLADHQVAYLLAFFAVLARSPFFYLFPYFYIFLPSSLSIFLSLCLSLYLSVSHPSPRLCLYLFFYISLYLSLSHSRTSLSLFHNLYIFLHPSSPPYPPPLPLAQLWIVIYQSIANISCWHLSTYLSLVFITRLYIIWDFRKKSQAVG